MHAVFEGVIEGISRDLNGLTADAAQVSSNGTAYSRSPQRAVEDLLQGYRFGAETLDHCLQSGRVTRRQNRSRVQWILQIMILSFGHVPEGAELPAALEDKPVRLGPTSGRELVQVLREELGAMDVLLDRCRAKFGMERVAVHPLLGPLRVDQWRRLYAVYTTHYFQQARAARPFKPAESVKLAQKMHIPVHRPLA